MRAPSATTATSAATRARPQVGSRARINRPSARCRKAAISARVVEAVGQKRVAVQPPVMFALRRRLMAFSWVEVSSSLK